MPIPRQQIVEAADGLVGDAAEGVGEPGRRVDIVEARGLDEGVEDGGTLSAAI